jgi:hypothetical protein
MVLVECCVDDTRDWSHTRVVFPWFEVGQTARAVPSGNPVTLARLMADSGVVFTIVGSTASGGPTRDLDIVVASDPEGLARLRSGLESVAVGAWRENLGRLASGMQGPHMIHTVLGPLDIWLDDSHDHE